jgi:hypothetical protein
VLVPQGAVPVRHSRELPKMLLKAAEDFSARTNGSAIFLLSA